MRGINNLIKIKNKVIGLEIRIEDNNEVTIHGCILIKENESIDLIDTFRFVDFESLYDYLPGNIPIYVNFNRRGILTRKLANSELTNNKQYLEQIIRSGNVDDFFIQNLKVENSVFVSVSRKDQILSQLSELKDKKENVVSVNLGPAVIDIANTFIGTDTGEIRSGSYRLTYENRNLRNIEILKDLVENKITIGDTKIQPEYLLSFCSAMKAFVPFTTVEVRDPQIEERKRQFRHKQIYKKGKVALIATTFSLLIINAIVYMMAFQTNKSYADEMATVHGSLNTLKLFEKRKLEQTQIFDQSGWLENSRTAFMLDRIGASVPSQVSLYQMQVFPKDDDKAQNYNSSRIVIHGYCPSTLVINEWIRNLKSKEWVVEANLDSYVSEKRGIKGDFSISIQLKT